MGPLRFFEEPLLGQSTSARPVVLRPRMRRPFKSEARSVILFGYEARNRTDDWILRAASFALEDTFGDRAPGTAVDDSEPRPTGRATEVYNVSLTH